MELTMKKRLQWSFAASVLVSAFLSSPLTFRAADFRRETIYQIVTDRFFDGSPGNNNPTQSAGLYDGTKTNWRAYWGGDFAGIQQKMAYLAGLGVTAIWISPPVDNLNANIPDGGGNPTASYHGYQARDFKRIEEHFGSGDNQWTDFDNLVKVAHQNGIKVIVDFAPNHATQTNAGEFGALYDNGTLLGNYPNDTLGLFHHNANISGGGWDDRYQVQYYTLFDLADLNQENGQVDAYLKSAAQLFQQHGVDGFRIDAVKHATWGWEYTLANSIYSNGDSFLFGEWYQGNSSDPLYPDSYKFANKSGISLLDFPLNAAVRSVLASNANWTEVDAVIKQEANDFTRDDDLVTFIDNHDMARFLSVNNNKNRLHEALAFIQTARGIPAIYYGTEQYLHNDTSGGTDPYNRPMMPGFDPITTAYKLIGKLARLRRDNPAIGYGSMTQRWINKDVYVYERQFFDSVVLVAINKNESTPYAIADLKTSLPPGPQTDYLGGLLGGPALTVKGTAGANSVATFSVPPHSVGVWQFTAGTGGPQAGSVGPTAAQPGVKVTVGGQNFGTTKGAVKLGTTAIPAGQIVSWSATRIVFTVPTISNGNYSLTVANAAGQASNGQPFTVLTGKLTPVTFTVFNASPTVMGDYIFLTGNTVELGNWSTTWTGTVGPMLTPNYPNWFICAGVPAGQTIQFKFIKIAADGTVTWEAGANHTFTVPVTGTGFVNVNWQY
jgi:glycosidase